MSTSGPLSDLAHLNVVICCGSGGVGKTTVASALGLTMARQGRKVLVCTIDPARRLAEALGMAGLGHGDDGCSWRSARVDPVRLASAGLDMGGGALWAQMLDTKHTFDRLVERYAPTAAIRERILQNVYYQHMSRDLAGSQEYMAMEKLYELSASGAYDAIVLDTPPTKHALDFLLAPGRMRSFFDSRALRWFMAPKGGGILGAAGRLGGSVVARGLSVVMGAEVLQRLSDLLLGFESLYAGFIERSRQVEAILKGERTRFLLVTAPRRGSVDEALYFHQRIRELDMRLLAMVVNRIHPPVPLSNGYAGNRTALEQMLRGATEPELKAALPAPLVSALLDNIETNRAWAREDEDQLAALRAATDRQLPLIRIPVLDREVHDLEALAEIARHLTDHA